MIYSGARHLVLPLLAIIFQINDCLGSSTYDQLVSQLRPNLRGGGEAPRRLPSYRPTSQRSPKGGKAKGRFITINSQSSATSSDVKEFEGIYEDGAPNKTAEAISSVKENSIKPSVSIGNVNLGVDIKFTSKNQQTISLGGHEAKNSSSKSNTISIDPVINGVPLSRQTGKPLTFQLPNGNLGNILGNPNGNLGNILGNLNGNRGNIFGLPFGNRGNANRPAKGNNRGNANGPARGNRGNANGPAKVNIRGNANGPARGNNRGNANGPVNVNIRGGPAKGNRVNVIGPAKGNNRGQSGGGRNNNRGGRRRGPFLVLG
ncbi:unnamed protein product [Orchesella dallaii]|uniref:Uncharacterized protein n=1 Tax=Orchesella dallaii TaxID=48710 RepID=A0ABP1RWC9_9HEXA